MLVGLVIRQPTHWSRSGSTGKCFLLAAYSIVPWIKRSLGRLGQATGREAVRAAAPAWAC